MFTDVLKLEISVVEIVLNTNPVSAEFTWTYLVPKSLKVDGVSDRLVKPIPGSSVIFLTIISPVTSNSLAFILPAVMTPPPEVGMVCPSASRV